MARVWWSSHKQQRNFRSDCHFTTIIITTPNIFWKRGVHAFCWVTDALGLASEKLRLFWRLMVDQRIFKTLHVAFYFYFWTACIKTHKSNSTSWSARAMMWLCVCIFSTACFFFPSISAKCQWWQPESADHCQNPTDPTAVFGLKTNWHPTLCRLKCQQSCVWRRNHIHCFGRHAQIVTNCMFLGIIAFEVEKEVVDVHFGVMCECLAMCSCMLFICLCTCLYLHSVELPCLHCSH